jgi:ankyrin repeat protein
MFAVAKDHKDIVDVLLAHNCNGDLQDNNGWNALMMAAEESHKDVVDALIRNKCSLDLQNNEGFTALSIAKDNDRVEIVALIEIQLRRNRNWDHRKALMLVLTGSNYLLQTSSLISSSSAAIVVDRGRVVLSPLVVGCEDADLTGSKKVLCDMFLVQHIMRYI